MIYFACIEFNQTELKRSFVVQAEKEIKTPSDFDEFWYRWADEHNHHRRTFTVTALTPLAEHTTD